MSIFSTWNLSRSSDFQLAHYIKTVKRQIMVSDFEQTLISSILFQIFVSNIHHQHRCNHAFCPQNAKIFVIDSPRKPYNLNEIFSPQNCTYIYTVLLLPLGLQTSIFSEHMINNRVRLVFNHKQKFIKYQLWFLVFVESSTWDITSGSNGNGD